MSRVIDTLTPWERITRGMPLPSDLDWIRAKDERIAELEAQAGLYHGQNNFEFHVVSDDIFDATHAAHEWLNRQRGEAKTDERQRILAALTAFIEGGCGSFRNWLDHLGMDYCSAYNEGWMNFTNALSDHEDRIQSKTPEGKP